MHAQELKTVPDVLGSTDYMPSLPPYPDEPTVELGEVGDSSRAMPAGQIFLPRRSMEVDSVSYLVFLLLSRRLSVSAASSIHSVPGG